MRRRNAARVLIGLALGVVGVAGCERSAQNDAAPVEIDEVVRATAAPVGWMASRIAGDLVPVEMLCPPGQLPATWRPGPETVAEYQRARLIVVNGARFERWANNAPLPRSRVVVSASAIDGELLVVTGETHSHGPEGAHAHDVIDGHTWIDPINAIAQAGAIAEAMAAAFPEHAIEFRANHAALADELRSLHERLGEIDRSRVRIIAPESPFGYLARRHGWTTETIHANPSDWAMDLARMSESASVDFGDGVPTVMLCEALPDEATADALRASHSVQLVLWDTGELAAGDRGYVDILAANIERLEAAVAVQTP